MVYAHFFFPLVNSKIWSFQGFHRLIKQRSLFHCVHSFDLSSNRYSKLPPASHLKSSLQLDQISSCGNIAVAFKFSCPTQQSPSAASQFLHPHSTKAQWHHPEDGNKTLYQSNLQWSNSELCACVLMRKKMRYKNEYEVIDFIGTKGLH